MIAIEQQIQPLDRKQRQREIRQALVDAGLVRAPLRLFGKVDAEVAGRVEVLANALQELGPIFSAFGRHLATRADLLSLGDCSKLAAIPDATPAVSLAEFGTPQVLELLSQNGDIQDVPFVHKSLCQWHTGVLHDGREVDVKFVRAITDAERLDLQLLPELQSAVEPLLANPALFQSAVAGFRAWTVAETEPRRLVEAFRTLQYDARQIELLRAPVVIEELCSDHCITIERIPGYRLSDVLSELASAVRSDDSSISGSRTVDSGVPAGLIPSELGRTISEVWLRQSFRGSLMPTDFRPENIVVVSSTEIAITDGQFTVLPADARASLSNYLIATASSEVETAVRHLLGEFDLSRRTAADSEIARHFRQAVVPPAEGAHGGQRISDEFATHWRIALEGGLRPLNHLTSMIRGISTLSQTTATLAPERDSLLDGIRNLRTSQLAHEVTNLMDPARWGSDFDRIAEVLMFGPQRLEGALSSLSTDTVKVKVRGDRDAHRSRGGGVLLVVCIAFCVANHDALTTLSDSSNGVLYLLLGGLVFQHFAKSHGG